MSNVLSSWTSAKMAGLGCLASFNTGTSTTTPSPASTLWSTELETSDSAGASPRSTTALLVSTPSASSPGVTSTTAMTIGSNVLQLFQAYLGVAWVAGPLISHLILTSRRGRGSPSGLTRNRYPHLDLLIRCPMRRDQNSEVFANMAPFRPCGAFGNLKATSLRPSLMISVCKICRWDGKTAAVDVCPSKAIQNAWTCMALHRSSACGSLALRTFLGQFGLVLT
jgi:hypothetical protein